MNRKTELWKQKNHQCYNNVGSPTALRTKEVIHLDSNNLLHTKWNCKYHLVFAPKKFGNRHFWCRGYYVNTVGKNAKKIQEYIQNQLKEDYEYD